MSVNSIQSIKTGTASPGQTTGAINDSDFAGILNGTTKNATVDLDSIFEAASRKYNVPLNLLKAVAKVESSFHPDATSRCGAMGIMQLMPRTAKWLGVTDAYDPQQNIMGGAKYLSKLLNQYNGDAGLALAAYNAGPGTVRKYGNTIPPFAQGYVNKVMRNIEGNFTAGFASVSHVPSVNAENILSSAAEDTGDDVLASLLLQTTINQMRLLQNMDVEQYDRNPIFDTQG